jgi:hypothetical protein
LTAWREANPEAAAVAVPAVQRFDSGFTEPQPWTFDGCQRREAVLDHDHNPPRVVRRVGWNLCLCCGKAFWSTDTTKIRMCDTCKAAPAIRKPFRL